MKLKAEDKFSKYFIALIPPPPVFEDAMLQKQRFKDCYNSKASLNSPPHITLHMPFIWKVKKEAELVQSLNTFASAMTPIDIQLDNFSSFPPRVIFINVVSSAALESLQKELLRFCKRELNLFNADYRDLPFHPHLTLAFRDLKKPNYQKAWEEFEKKEYKARFTADKLVLLKHDGRVWNVFLQFALGDRAAAPAVTAA